MEGTQNPAKERAGRSTMITGVKLVAFDLDGTMVDSCPDLHDACNKTCQAMNKPAVTVEAVASWIGNGADMLIARALSGSVDPDPSLTVEEKKQGRELFDKFYGEGGSALSRVYPGVVETLTALHDKKVHLAVVTNKPSQFVPHVLKVHKLDIFFRDVIGGDTFPEKKPDPCALKWLMERYKVKPEETVMVGDSRNDILAGKAAGCHTVGMTYGYNYGEHISKEGPDVCLDSFEGIRDTVKGASCWCTSDICALRATCPRGHGT